jgi:isopenicillin N synthase-like dioxygenase
MNAPPVINGLSVLSRDGGTETPSQALCEEIAAACKSWGVFHLINHGLDERLIQRMTRAMHAFFQLPYHVKASVRRTEDNAMGWADDELTKQRRDLKEVFDWCWASNPRA